jgi:Icc-related predicted phosphoesterase
MNLTHVRSARLPAALSLLSAAVFLAGCKEKPAQTEAPPRQATPVAQPQQKPPAPRVERECAAPIDLAPPQEVKIADRTATRTGYKLTFSEKGADGALVLGVLGPINEDTGQNIFALRKYLQFFKDEKVDGIVIGGDLGETEESITRVLNEVGQAGLPTFVMIGNRECRADYTNGVLAAQKTHPHIVNFNEVRAVEFPEATLVSLPGYHNDTYLHCKQGCLYLKSTVDEVVGVAREAKSPVVLVAHGPPKGEGSQALDWATSGGNIGDPEVNRAINDGNIRFGFFSNVKEAGARAVDAPEGNTLVAQGKPSKRLYLNPGPADTEGWKMNDETQSAGMASVFSIKDGEATWKLYRAKALTPAERHQAQALSPSR